MIQCRSESHKNKGRSTKQGRETLKPAKAISDKSKICGEHTVSFNRTSHYQRASLTKMKRQIQHKEGKKTKNTGRTFKHPPKKEGANFVLEKTTHQSRRREREPFFFFFPPSSSKEVSSRTHYLTSFRRKSGTPPFTKFHFRSNNLQRKWNKTRESPRGSA